MSLSIVIPAHNEGKNIAQVIKSIEQNVFSDHEIIVIDDHSSDNTAEAVHQVARENKNVRLINNDYEQGFASALRKGFDCVSRDMILPVMADSCDDPRTINEMFKMAVSGFDVVCGSRYMKGGGKIGGPRLKTFFSRFVGFTLHLLIGIPTKDISNSFKLYKRHVIENTALDSVGFEISVEIPLKAYFSGYKISEVPTTWTDRKEGKSKFNVLKQGRNYLKLYFWAIYKRFSGAI